MKLRTAVKALGQPFPFYPHLVKKCGISVNACVFYSFIVWKTFEDDQRSWFAFTTEQIEKVTGLTVKEQATARKQLTEKGLIEDHYSRLNHQLQFRLGEYDVDESGEWPNAEVANAPLGHTPNEQMGNCQDSVSSKGQRPEERPGQRQEGAEARFALEPGGSAKPPKAKKPKASPSEPVPIPKSLDVPEFQEAWADWLAYRRQIRKPLALMTQHQKLEGIQKFGVRSCVEAIRDAISSGWIGFFPKESDNERPATSRNSKPASEAQHAEGW